jgi:hypothetical protein
MLKWKEESREKRREKVSESFFLLSIQVYSTVLLLARLSSLHVNNAINIRSRLWLTFFFLHKVNFPKHSLLINISWFFLYISLLHCYICEVVLTHNYNYQVALTNVRQFNDDKVSVEEVNLLALMKRKKT